MDLGKDLTKRQQEIFDFIKKYSAKYSSSWDVTCAKRGSSETSPGPKSTRVSAPSSATVRRRGPMGEEIVVCMSFMTLVGGRP